MGEGGGRRHGHLYDGNSRFGAQAMALALRGAQVYDTRNSGGYMPSDHKPLLVTFEVR